MDRRTFLVATGAAAATGTAAGGRDEARAAGADHVQPRPDARVVRARLSKWFSQPFFRDLAERFARHLIEISDGRMRLEFDADGIDRNTGGGIWFSSADEGSGAVPALSYFAGLPGDLGLAADVHRAWLQAGGGQLLWDDAAFDAGFKPLMIGHTDTTAGGWAARDFATASDFHGVSVAAVGLAAAVAGRLGARTDAAATPITAADLAGARADYTEPLVSFTVAAADGFGDGGATWIRDGLRPAGAALVAAIDAKLWHELSPADRAVFAACAALTDSETAAAQRAHHAIVAPHIKAARRISATSFTDAAAAAIRHAAHDLVAEIAVHDRAAGRIHQAYMAFRSATTGLPDPLVDTKPYA
jgi:TRAP-type mannitol/chloroaromatic compound transport system substrate-binding protein